MSYLESIVEKDLPENFIEIIESNIKSDSDSFIIWKELEKSKEKESYSLMTIRLYINALHNIIQKKNG